jgi:hypothetical protein
MPKDSGFAAEHSHRGQSRTGMTARSILCDLSRAPDNVNAQRNLAKARAMMQQSDH